MRKSSSRPTSHGSRPRFSKKDWTVATFIFVAAAFLFFPLLPFIIIVGMIWLASKFIDWESVKKQLETTAASSEASKRTNGVRRLPQPSVATDGSSPFSLPRQNYFQLDKSAIDHYWSEAFDKNLKSFSGSNISRAGSSYGLIYYFLVDDQTRYIGQIRENSLKRRMNQLQPDGSIGYSLSIKRNLLQAASEGRLAIRTIQVLKSQLDQYEKAEIGTHARGGRLWNHEF